MTDGGGEGGTGLARERTELAWNRSGLAALVVVTVLLRRLWPLHGYKSVLTLTLIAVGSAVWALGMRLAQRVRLSSHVTGGLKGSTSRLLMIGTVVLAVAAFVVGLLFPT